MSSGKIIRLSVNPESFGDMPDELSQEMFASAIPIQHSHAYFEDETLGLYVGLWDTTEMIEVSAPYPCEEFMVLLEGTAAIHDANRQGIEKVNVDESFVIPREYDCQWHQSGYLKKFYVIYENPNKKPAKPVRECIVKITDNSPADNSVLYQNADKTFIVGSTINMADKVNVAACHYHQFIYQRRGNLVITVQDDALSSREILIPAGEAVFIPAGISYQWQSTELILQDYVKVLAN